MTSHKTLKNKTHTDTARIPQKAKIYAFVLTILLKLTFRMLISVTGLAAYLYKLHVLVLFDKRNITLFKNVTFKFALSKAF